MSYCDTVCKKCSVVNSDDPMLQLAKKYADKIIAKITMMRASQDGTNGMRDHVVTLLEAYRASVSN